MTGVKIGLVIVAVCLGFWAPAAHSQSREFLGHGRLTSTDLFGDTADRWNSGSAAASRVRWPAWSGKRPDRPFSLLVRDPVTGQRYRTVQRRVEGLGLVFGGALAALPDSVPLPADKGVTPTDTRTRLRAGLHCQGARNAVFYGLTWMSGEFTAQPKGQLIGSMRLQLRF